MSREAKILVGILSVVVVGMIGLFVLANNNSSTSTSVDQATLVRSDSPKYGTGSITLVEFGDFQCPACGKISPAVEQIMKDYAGKVTLVYRNFPLSQHPNAVPAANAAMSANAQGKFWDMYVKLYADQAAWVDLKDPTPKFQEYATAMNLDMAKFNNDYTTKAFQSLIDRDVTDATTLGVNSTPTFYVNGVVVTNAASYADLKTAIDNAQK